MSQTKGDDGLIYPSPSVQRFLNSPTPGTASCPILTNSTGRRQGSAGTASTIGISEKPHNPYSQYSHAGRLRCGDVHRKCASWIGKTPAAGKSARGRPAVVRNSYTVVFTQ